MKRTTILAIATLTCILTGCSRNEMDILGPDTEGNTILASVAKVGSPQTKAIMQDQSGVAINVYWQGGDHIGIFGEGGSNVDFVLSAGTLVNGGKTAKFETTGTMPKGNLVAYYPYTSGITASNGVLSLTAPDKQKYTSYIPKPDPAANIMVARGTRNGGLLFQPVFAILKIGKIFESDTDVKSVEFRDLDGKAVCGKFNASFSNGKPVTEFTGSSNVLTLECGNFGKAYAGQTKVFYLFVPARSYPKGYEITFVTSGGKITQTVGASSGKTLQSATVYTVGDITQYDKIEGVQCETYPEAIIMNQQSQDRIIIQEKTEHVVNDKNGNILWDNHNNAVHSYDMTLMVPNDLNPKEGGWLVYDEPTEWLPYGGVFQITKCVKLDEKYNTVIARSVLNPFAPYKNLKIGEEGNEIPVNLNGFISEIVDEQGNPIDFTYNADGQLVFDDDAFSQMMGKESSQNTKAVVNKWPSRFSLPDFSISVKAPEAEATFTPQLTTDVSTAIGAFDGELQYVVLKINPTLSMKAEFSLKKSYYVGKDKYLFGLKTTGIPMGGVVVFFEIEVYAKVEVGGEIVLTATMSCSQDLGTYAISYNSGDGVNTRKLKEASAAGYNMDDPTIKGSGSIYLKGGLTLASSVNVYGLLSIGLATDFLVKGEIKDEYEGLNDKGLRFAVTPEMEITPRIAVNCLGIQWAHRFEELTMKFNFDPWYETWLVPAVAALVGVKYSMTKEHYVFEFEAPDDIWHGNTYVTQLKTGVESLSYSAEIEGKCSRDYRLGIAIYQISSFSFVTYNGEQFLPSLIEFKYFRAAGYPALHAQHIQNPVVKLVHVQKLDQFYKAGTKSQEFKGEIKPDFRFDSHTVYAPLLVLMQDDEIRYTIGLRHLLYGKTSGGNLIYYCWPKDYNGNSYMPYKDY